MIVQRVDFARKASVYDQPHGAILTADAAAKLIDAASLRGATVLDVGAGTGRVALALAHLGSTVVAFDSSAALLDKLRVKSSAIAVTVVVGDS